MLKSIAAVFCITLFASAAHSQTQPESLPIEPVDFVCYVEDSSGQLTDLTKLCGAGRISPPRAVAPAPAPATPTAAPTGRSAAALSPETNLGGLNVGGQDGSPLCFGFDAQGRACP
jgi:hypothetical protein